MKILFIFFLDGHKEDSEKDAASCGMEQPKKEICVLILLILLVES